MPTANSLPEAIYTWWQSQTTLGTAIPGGLVFIGAQQTPAVKPWCTYNVTSVREKSTDTTERYNSTVTFEIRADDDTTMCAARKAVQDAICPQGADATTWSWYRGKSALAVLLGDTFRKPPVVGVNNTVPFTDVVRFQVRELRQK